MAWEYTSLINVDMQDPFEAKIFVAKPKTFRRHALIGRVLQSSSSKIVGVPPPMYRESKS